MASSRPTTTSTTTPFKELNQNSQYNQNQRCSSKEETKSYKSSLSSISRKRTRTAAIIFKQKQNALSKLITDITCDSDDDNGNNEESTLNSTYTVHEIEDEPESDLENQVCTNLISSNESSTDTDAESVETVKENLNYIQNRKKVLHKYPQQNDSGSDLESQNFEYTLSSSSSSSESFSDALTVSKFQSKPSISTNLKNVSQRDYYKDITDLTKLEEISLESVLQCIKERFYTGSYCTFAGSVLISLNPCFQKHSVSTDVNIMSLFIQQLQKPFGDAWSLKPHIFSIGVKSLRNIQTVGNDQVVIVSGDSGAGKTTCTQHLIQFLSYANNLQLRTSALENKIYYATIILEAFGNSSTIANSNSSRFGRLVQLRYGRNNNIVGAEIKTYLLEKHRVANCVANERNFHIFYYIIQGLNFNYLSAENCIIPESFKGKIEDSDMKDFVMFMKALRWFDIEEEFLDVFKTLYGIMNLCNLKFEQEVGKGGDHQIGTPRFKIVQRYLLSYVCNVFGLSGKIKDLEDVLVAQKICPGNRRQSVVLSPCKSEDECKARLQAFTATIYERLFNYILNRVNSLLVDDKDQAEHSNSKKKCNTISLLDLYGFESLNYNHLEQLCINYANERLQQVQITVLKKYFDEDKQLEGMPISTITEPVELGRVELEINSRIEEIDRFLFMNLNEKSMLKQSRADASVFDELQHINQKADLKFITCLRNHIRNDFQFIIRHYATDVTYSFSGMIDKNRDNVPEEFATLLSSSSSTVISKLFPRHQNNFTPRSRNSKNGTILIRFKSSVNELMKELCDGNNKDIHFVRCIRPNSGMIQDVMEHDLLRKQLYSCGIVDIIRITGKGYPIRYSIDKFKSDFVNVSRAIGRSNFHKRLGLIFEFPKCPISVGRAHIFTDEQTVISFKKYENFITYSSVIKVQKMWRGYQFQRRTAAELLKKTPIQSFQETCTQWYTPMEGDSCALISPMHSSTPTSALRADVNRKLFKTLVSDTLDAGTGGGDHSYIKTLDASDTTTYLEDENYNDTILKDIVETRPKKGITITKEDNFIRGDRIVSRTPIHTLPIKFYTKKTALGFSFRPPQRLISNGLQDAYEDYGIITDPRS